MFFCIYLKLDKLKNDYIIRYFDFNQNRLHSAGGQRRTQFVKLDNIV